MPPRRRQDPIGQEKVAGAKIEGTAAIWLNFAAAVAIAIAATALSGGLGSYDPSDPTGFVGAMLGKAAGVFALSQIVSHSAQPAVMKLGGTAKAGGRASVSRRPHRSCPATGVVRLPLTYSISML